MSAGGGMGVRLSEERLRQLVDMAGGEDALRESERRYRDNLQYLETHHEELTGLYPASGSASSTGRCGRMRATRTMSCA